MIVAENYQIEDLLTISSLIIDLAKDKKIWAFSGAMGAGKTTLIKAICQSLEVINEVNSPTFSLVNEYHTQEHKRVYHFDFYRIKDINEVYDIGYEEYFDSGNICLIEWPEKIDVLLEEEDVFKIEITNMANKRSISID